MQVSLENMGALERRMKVQLSEEEFSSDIARRLEEISKTTRVPGFRPGKVPMKIIQTRFGKKVRQEVVGQKVQSSYQEALTQEKLTPAGFPNIDMDESKAGGISYLATFEVMPEIELAGINTLEIDKPETEICDQDLSKMIERLRKQQAQWQTVDTEAVEGNSLIIDFKGKINNDSFPGSEATDFQLELGTEQMIDGFETGLLGSRGGEERILNLKFPDEYHAEDVAGKDVVFEVSIKEVQQIQLPELDEAFFKAFGVSDGGIDAFKAELKKNMERELQKNISTILRDNVTDALLEAHSLELPKVMVDTEAQRLQEEFVNNLKQRGISKEDIEKTEPMLFQKQAKKRVSLQLLFSEIISQNKLKADPKKVRQLIEQEAQSYAESSSSIINWYYQDASRLREVEAVVLEREVIEWVMNQCKTNSVQMSFDDIMNNRQTGSA